MKRSLTLAIIVTLAYFATAFTALSFAADKGSSATAGRLLRDTCKRAPDVQVVNNSTVSIYQVKLGKTIFSQYLSTCFNGCSTAFKPVHEGKLAVLIKFSPKDAWLNIGSLGIFSNCRHYAVNIRKNKNTICADLFERFDTTPTFNADRTKKKIASICKRIALTGIRPVAPKPVNASSHAGAMPSNSNSFSQPARPAAAPVSRVQMRTVRPEITYLRFKKAVNNTGTFSAPALAPGAASSSDRPAHVRADYGESVELACGFTTENVRTLRVKLVYENGSHSNLTPGDGRQTSDGKTHYSFTTHVLATQSQTLTLEVTGYANGAGGIAREEKDLELEVKSPVFQNRQAEFNNDTRQLTFRLKNAGNMDFPDDHNIRLEYRIVGMPGNRQIEQQTRMIRHTINRNQTIDLYTITLPESALAYPRFRAEVTVGGRCNGADLPEDENTYRYEWETHTFTINETLVDAFSSLFNGNVRINTFKQGQGNSSKHQPYDGDDSRINLTVAGPTGPRTVFDQAIPIPSFKFGTDGFEAVVFINELISEIDGRNLFFIRDGKLGLRIEFDCSKNREIEVWARDAIAKRWVDSWLPDLDLRSFSIELMLTPSLAGQKLSYSNLNMNANVNLNMPGHRVEHWLERVAAREIENGFAPVFDNASVKTTIEDTFASLLESPLFNIRYLVSVRGAGNTIVLTYR